MRNRIPTLIFSFSTTTDAMSAEKYCILNNLPGRIIPLPSEISADCGLAWKTEPDNEQLLVEAFHSAGIKWDSKNILLL